MLQGVSGSETSIVTRHGVCSAHCLQKHRGNTPACRIVIHKGIVEIA